MNEEAKKWLRNNRNFETETELTVETLISALSNVSSCRTRTLEINPIKFSHVIDVKSVTETNLTEDYTRILDQCSPKKNQSPTKSFYLHSLTATMTVRSVLPSSFTAY